MKIKTASWLFAIGLIIGLTSPHIVEAINASGGAVEGGAYDLSSYEDSYEVDPIDEDPDYSEETYACEGARHVHYHTNTSTDDANNEYWGIVHAFAIVLDTDYPGGNPATNDFLENVDTSTLLCTDGDSTYVDCSFDKDTIALGTEIWSTSGGTWDGVSITYDTLDWIDGNPRGLIWEYGTNDPTNVNIKPWLASGSTKLEAVSWDSLDDYTQEYTVTTESWTKMEFYSFHPDGSYDHVYTEDVDPDGDGDDEETGVDPDGDYVYWYGLNARLRSIFPICEVPAITCSTLTLDPSSLDVGDVFTNTDFEVTATGSDGTTTTDITNDAEFSYYANRYGTTAYDAADASGYFYSNILSQGNPLENTGDSTVTYRNSDPGDWLHICVSDYEGSNYCGTGVCEVEIEFPYCTDLNFTNPSSSAFILTDATSYEEDLTIDTDASSAATAAVDWPYAVTYESTDSNATFDGDTTPYTTAATDQPITYYSEEDATVSVGLDDENNDGESDDVAGLCTDEFTYTITPPPECLYLDIYEPATVVSVADMEAGSVEISWTGQMSDGTVLLPPFTCTSTNPAGEFVDAAGLTGTGSITTNTYTVYYTGEPGDSVTCTSDNYPACTDTITSETPPEEISPVCEELTLSNPYIINDDGTITYLDWTNPADLALLYGETVVCWDYNLAVSDVSYAGTLVAAGYTDTTMTAYNGNLSLTMNETASSTTGNPATLGFTGFTSYTGTLCWENFEEGNYLSFSVLGDEAACSHEATFPELPEEDIPVCVDLQMSPDSYTMSYSDATAGTITITIEVTGSDSTWTGTLIVERTGSGDLFYSDGSPSTEGDGHLEIPVSGTSTTVTVTYVDGVAGDVVTAYIEGEVALCTDNLSISQTPPPGGDDDDDDDDSADDDDDDSADDDDDDSADDDDDDDDDVTEVCEDVEFEEEVLEVDFNCEDVEGVELCIDSEGDSERTIEVCYYDQNGDEGSFEYNGSTYEGCQDITVEFNAGETFKCIDLSFDEVCEGAEISVLEEGDVCEEITAEEIEMGNFEKFIYTFNFASEKNSYSDEGVFFAHDEDRAFYTLEYDPTGDENDITFTDEMWSGALYGTKGDGTDSGGTVTLAETYEELTSGNAYDYETITLFGFGSNSAGELLEENSSTIAEYIKNNYNTGYYTTFIPYIKLPDDGDSDENDDESVMILECEYDASGELTSENVCYDPNVTPEEEGIIVIENAGTVEDQYGVEAVIRIRYVGIITSGLSCDDETDECLTEEFQNTASVQVVDGLDSLTASARLVVFCSYLMTQNAGDVYLEVELEGGSDISCIYVDDDETVSSTYRNVDSLVILEDGSEDDEETVSPYETSYSDSTISFCDGDTSSGSLIGNLSSYVCEIINSVAELWKRSTVESTTESHVSQATRNASTNQSLISGAVNSWTELLNLQNNNNPDSHILYFDGSQSGARSLQLSTIEVPEGAWTLIVENADLILSGDIQYAPVTDASDYKNLPSIAFIVLGGNIYIENSSYKLVGVYYTNLYFEGDTDGTSRSPVDQPLSVDGSFYGNIQHLLEQADYVGPPTLDGAGIVIRYDSRILLNTPPALSEYVNISTEKAIN